MSIIPEEGADSVSYVQESEYAKLQKECAQLAEDNRRLRTLVGHLRGGIRFLATAAEVVSEKYGE